MALCINVLAVDSGNLFSKSLLLKAARRVSFPRRVGITAGHVLQHAVSAPIRWFYALQLQRMVYHYPDCVTAASRRSKEIHGEA